MVVEGCVAIELESNVVDSFLLTGGQRLEAALRLCWRSSATSDSRLEEHRPWNPVPEVLMCEAVPSKPLKIRGG
jgi:hypothetical protein